MINKRFAGLLSATGLKSTVLPVAVLAATSLSVNASPAISGGIWLNYTYVTNDGDSSDYADVIADQEGGYAGDEALILYFDDQKEGSPWSVSAEMRYGPGAYTRPDENDTGDNFALHKAWVGYQAGEQTMIRIGKSQVPFGWKTVNNWAGDMLLGGFGDQMDVGVKLSSHLNDFTYDIAYFHADDWGETSTDTQSDNGHWGSPVSYRKVQTFVTNGDYEFAADQKIGLSLQSGKLQNLADDRHTVDGDHHAWAVYYRGEFDRFSVSAEYMGMERNLPSGYSNTLGGDQVKNERGAITLGYTTGDWFCYLDATYAKPKTRLNDSKSVSAFTPGVSYDYGEGWIYLEYLTQNGYVDRNSMVSEGDYSALYATIDYYF